MKNTLPPLPNIALGEYEHYKGGRYRVIGIARHSETLEPVVVYQHLGDQSLWVRPAAMFVETVGIDEKTVPRFVRIGD